MGGLPLLCPHCNHFNLLSNGKVLSYNEHELSEHLVLRNMRDIPTINGSNMASWQIPPKQIGVDVPLPPENKTGW